MGTLHSSHDNNAWDIVQITVCHMILVVMTTVTMGAITMETVTHNAAIAIATPRTSPVAKATHSYTAEEMGRQF